jgi:hypothetical protein
MRLTKKPNIADYNMTLVGTTYFDSYPGNPKDSVHYIDAKDVNKEGYFLLINLKTIK